MKPSYAPLRESVVVIATVVMLGVPAHSAPKKTEPQPAPEETVLPKNGVVGKLKSSTGSKKKTEVAEPAAGTKPAPKLPPAAKPKSAKNAGPISVPKATPVAVEATPEKKGFIRKLFGKKPKPEADAEPKLAKVKTVKPAPVKEVKPVKAVKPDEKLARSAEEEAPKKKRGLFGFLRRDRSAAFEEENEGAPVPDDAKIERPEDWAERSIVNDDEIALYEYGPSQANGPDARLGRGTLVKVKQIKRGWALVEVAGGRRGYMDAAALRSAAKDDFRDPAPVVPAMASLSPDYWAPAAPPPDLPDTPAATDNNDAALLLLPPLEPEPKKP